MNHTTQIWTAVRPLVDAGRLEANEVEKACTLFGLPSKQGVTEKVIQGLMNIAADPTHWREQQTMHRFKITREMLHKLLVLGSVEPLQVKHAEKAFGAQTWKHWRPRFEANGYLYTEYGKTGRVIAMERTQRLFNVLDYYKEVSV